MRAGHSLAVIALAASATGLGAQTRGGAAPDTVRRRPVTGAPARPAPQRAVRPAATPHLPALLEMLDSLWARAYRDTAFGEYGQHRGMREVVRAHIRIKQFDRARKLTLQFTDATMRDETTGELGVAMVRAGRELAGLALIDSLIPWARREPYLELAAWFAESGRRERGRELLVRSNEIERESLRQSGQVSAGPPFELLPVLRALGDSVEERATLSGFLARTGGSPSSSLAMPTLEQLDDLGYRGLVWAQAQAWHLTARQMFGRTDDQRMRMNRLGSFFLRVGDYETALATATYESNAASIVSMAQRLGEVGAASPLFEKALASIAREGSDEAQRKVRLLLAAAYAREGRVTAADSVLTIVLAGGAQPSDDVSSEIAHLWSRAGDTAKARRALAQVRDPQRVEAIEGDLLLDSYIRAPTATVARTLVQRAEKAHFTFRRDAAHALAKGGACREAISIVTRHLRGLELADLAPVLDRCGAGAP